MDFTKYSQKMHALLQVLETVLNTVYMIITTRKRLLLYEKDNCLNDCQLTLS